MKDLQLFFQCISETFLKTVTVFLTKAKASISLSKEGSNIYSYESKEYKEGGLDWDQAQERAVIKLFRDINADEKFISQMKDAIYKAAQESTE